MSKFHTTWNGARTLCGLPAVANPADADEPCVECAGAYADHMCEMYVNRSRADWMTDYLRGWHPTLGDDLLAEFVTRES